MIHGLSPLHAFAAGPAPYPVGSAAYPIDALGPRLGAVVRAIEDASQAPVEMAAQAVLAVVSLAVQHHVAVRVPTSEIRPVSCFFLTVAESGERKSTVSGLALVPVRSFEEELARAAPFADLDYRARLQAWRLYRARLTRASLRAWSGGSGARGEADAAELEEKFLERKPLAPAPPFLVSTSLAVGLLCDQLKARPSLLLCSDAAAPLRNFAKAPGAAFLRDIWDAGALTVGRGRTAQRLGGRRLALHVTVPPAEGYVLLGDPLLAREGVLARFLIAAPPSRIGRRPWREPAGGACPAAFVERIGALLHSGLGPPADVGEVLVRIMEFSKAAKARWTQFAGEMEARMALGGDFAALRAAGAKLPQQAARLAALLAAYDDENAPEIAEAHADGGIALARWYGAEALRLCVPPVAIESRDRAQVVLTWLKRSHPTGPFALSEVYGDGPSFVRTADAARAFLQTLAKDGHVRLTNIGRRGGESWELTQKC